MRWLTSTLVVTGALALVGFAGAAQASATVDLIWIDVSNVDTNGNPICLRLAERNCPRLGTTLSSAAVTDIITLGVIITAGPYGLQGAGVSVNYGDALPRLRVLDFRSLNTEIFLPFGLGTTTNQPPLIENINSLSHPRAAIGIGLPAGQSAYLGTVTFHKDHLAAGTFEIGVGVDGLTDAVLSLAPLGVDISETTTFNSAFVGFPGSTPTPTAAHTASPTTSPILTPTAAASATPIPTPTVTLTGAPGPTATPGPTAVPNLPRWPSPFRGGPVMPIFVEIDVSPSRGINQVQLGSHQRVLVVILGSEAIDVSRVDLESLYFGPNDAPNIPGTKPALLGDRNRDGFTDLLVRFDMGETGIAAGDTYVCLEGKIYGERFLGCDTIETFAPPGRQP
jgi:hypothetical protein